MVLLLAGLANTCVHAPEPKQVPAAEKPTETVAAPNLEVIKEPLVPAVQSLLKKSQQALEQKQYQEAEAHAERAYRMEGKDFRVLFMLARVSLGSGSPADAEQWALRALGFLPAKYKGHRIQAWEFIARARSLRGDQAGHDEALAQARGVR